MSFSSTQLSPPRAMASIQSISTILVCFPMGGVGSSGMFGYLDTRMSCGVRVSLVSWAGVAFGRGEGCVGLVVPIYGPLGGRGLVCPRV